MRDKEARKQIDGIRYGAGSIGQELEKLRREVRDSFEVVNHRLAGLITCLSLGKHEWESRNGGVIKCRRCGVVNFKGGKDVAKIVEKLNKPDKKGQ